MPLSDRIDFIENTQRNKNMSEKTAPQCLKYEILLIFWQMDDQDCLDNLTGEEIDSLYKQLEQEKNSLFEEAKEYIRTSGFTTEIPIDKNKKQDSDSVAIRTDDSSQLIGFTYFYSNPFGVEWIEDAYFVKTRDKTIVVTEYFK